MLMLLCGPPGMTLYVGVGTGEGMRGLSVMVAPNTVSPLLPELRMLATKARVPRLCIFSILDQVISVWAVLVGYTYSMLSLFSYCI